MNRRNLLCLFAAAALVIVAASCAPVGAPAVPGPTTTGAGSPSAAPAVSHETDGVVGDKLLKERIETVINQVRRRELLLDNGFWTVFHGILGVGPSVTLKHPLLGIHVNAVDYIASGGELRGLRFIPTPYGVDVEN